MPARSVRDTTIVLTAVIVGGGAEVTADSLGRPGKEGGASDELRGPWTDGYIWGVSRERGCKMLRREKEHHA